MIRVFLKQFPAGMTASAMMQSDIGFVDYALGNSYLATPSDLKIYPSVGEAIAVFPAGEWSRVEKFISDATPFEVDVSGYKYSIPNEHAKELWNELGRELNEANQGND